MSAILTHVENHVLTVTLNQPDVHNAISDDTMIKAIEAVCHEANHNAAIRVMILTGAGRSFCAGGNIKDMRDKSGMFAGDEATLERGYRSGIQRVPRALWNVSVPTIAAVNGAAVGAGCDLAAMCDIRIASHDAFFAESFVALGIIPGDGGAWFLPRVIGAARAAQMTLTGERLPAAKALDWGLISELCAPDALLARARNIATTIAANPPLAVQASKRLLRDSEKLSLDEMLARSAHVQAQLHHTEDHAEAVRAMLEHRRGHYRGH